MAEWDTLSTWARKKILKATGGWAESADLAAHELRGSEADTVFEYIADTQTNHVAKMCEVQGCENEASRWYEEPKSADHTQRYVCTDHPFAERAETKGTIENSEGKTVDFAAYACSDDCEVCNN